MIPQPPSPPAIRTVDPRVEVAWFSALCSDDYEYLGVPDGSLRSSFDHCSAIVRRADELGYQNILMPSSWQVGQETLPFSAATAKQTRQINHLVAVRMGEIHPPMLGRHLATLDHLLEGRLTVNIISSDLPGMKEDSGARYARSREVIEILKQCWTQRELSYRGKFYSLDLPSTAPAQPWQQNGGPLLYFGGISPDAVQLCAEHCDVFLMWPETEERLAETMHLVSNKAAALGRDLDFGLRIHIIVRETERAKREMLPSGFSPASMRCAALRSRPGPRIINLPAFCGRMNCAPKRKTTTSRSTSGAESAAREVAVQARS